MGQWWLNGIFYGAMVMMCSTTWAGVLPDISARGHCAFGGIYPYNYCMQGDFPSYHYMYHAVIKVSEFRSRPHL